MLGRWLVWAEDELMRSPGPAALLRRPEEDAVDEVDHYRRLLVVWAQLGAYALTSPAVAEQVGLANALAREMLAWQVDDVRSTEVTSLWLVLRGLQRELLRPGTDLTVAGAADLLAHAQTSPRSRSQR